MNRPLDGPLSRTPAINLAPVVLWLAAAFIAVHLVRQVLTPAWDEWVLLVFAFIPARYAEIGPGGVGALFWSPITYAFLHAGYLHLFVNIVWMASFGGPLARRFGSVRFLLLSLASAIGAAGVFYAVHPSEAVIVIGASGAISGMMAATARFAFAPGGPLGGGPPPGSFYVPAEPFLVVLRNGRAVAFILVWFGVNLLFGLGGSYVAGISGPIAWEAHIGGFLTGLLLFPLLDPIGHHPDERLAS